jgi:hypothetical protein
LNNGCRFGRWRHANRGQARFGVAQRLFQAECSALSLGLAAAGTEQQRHQRQTSGADGSKEKNARRKGAP